MANLSPTRSVTEFMKSVDSAPVWENADSEVDLKGMDSVIATFVRQFDLRTKIGKNSKITALRPMTGKILSVPNTVLLIPTKSASRKNPTIGNKAVLIGSYIYLTEDTLLEGGIDYLATLDVD